MDMMAVHEATLLGRKSQLTLRRCLYNLFLVASFTILMLSGLAATVPARLDRPVDALLPSQPQLLSSNENVLKRAEITKHVIVACQASICNHADFLE
jgi:hypothetical protein